jgi:hypothetical protein
VVCELCQELVRTVLCDGGGREGRWKAGLREVWGVDADIECCMGVGGQTGIYGSGFMV